MKYLPLIWAGLWRKPARTILTLLSVAAAFVLFGILHSVTATFADFSSQAGDKRLRSMSRISVLEPLPLAYLRRIGSVPGVEKVAYYCIFFGYYQEVDNGIGVGAISTKEFFDAFPEVIVSPEQVEAMVRTRTGAIIGKDLAEEYGWSIGDRVPLRSPRDTRTDGLDDWTFDIVGVYALENEALPANEFWINYDYFDEARTFGNGTLNFYFTVVDDESRSAEISEEIDALFVNSPNPTETKSENEYIRAQIEQVGDIEFFINSIIGAVLFALLFLTANTMMQSIRERIPEFAVLKTYGFGNGAIILLVCIEALILCVAAALVGLAAAATVFPSIFASIGAPDSPMPPVVIPVGIGIAVLLALVSAAPPIWRVRRLSIVDALAGR